MARRLPLLRAQSPYPERQEPVFGQLDFALTALAARVATKFRRASRFHDRLASTQQHLATFGRLGDDALAAATPQIRAAVLREGLRSDAALRSVALVCEMMYRTMGLRPYDEQIVAAIALLNGFFIEMATGEGKTLTGALAAATAALTGHPVHVITVNDYLADRDAALFRAVYERLGLTVGVVQHGQEPSVRSAAYRANVAYATNKEICFDYLRDGLALGMQRTRAARLLHRSEEQHTSDRLLLHGLWFAIVDEADSVLIDEARTPLIIAGGDADAGDDAVYRTALVIAGQLQSETHFVLAPVERAVRLTHAGSDAVAQETRDLGGLWAARRAREELIANALAAIHLYSADKHYAVIDGKVQIIDEFTGRIAEGRSWQHGLHQLIEVKENCAITAQHRTQASVTYQRFFRRYLHLCGMSGTLLEVAAELQAVCGPPVCQIPTHRPSRRVSHGMKLFRTAEEKWDAVIMSVRDHSRTGRPVLIGTRSIAISELLSEKLRSAGIEHVVLNARQDRNEAEVVAQAGEPGRVTVATNMAGRGTDIKLGEAATVAGGLHVVLTELHESRRIDRQFIGRGARQGDPGSYEIFASLEDELITVFAARFARLAAINRTRRGEPLPDVLAKLVRRSAQNAAGRFHGRIRRETFRSDAEREKALAFARPE